MDNRQATLERADDRPVGWTEADRELDVDARDRVVYGDPIPPRPDRAETAVEARQGWLDRPILVVLIAGLILAAAFVIATQIWTANEDTPETPGLVNDSPAVVDLAPVGAAPAVDLPSALPQAN